jgi:hypothetical protein
VDFTIIFSPSCIVRLPLLLVMMPKFDGLFTVVPNPPHVGEFVALYASARNWRFNRSTGLKFLNNDKSRLCMPGWRTFGRKRPTLPNA